MQGKGGPLEAMLIPANAYFTPCRRERFAVEASSFWRGLFNDFMHMIKQVSNGTIPGVEPGAQRGCEPDPVYACTRTPPAIKAGRGKRVSEATVRVKVTPLQGSAPKVEVCMNSGEPADFMLAGCAPSAPSCASSDSPSGPRWTASAGATALPARPKPDRRCWLPRSSATSPVTQHAACKQAEYTIEFDRLSYMAYTQYTPAGYLIRKARSQAGLSQAELAEEVGLAPGRVSDYERGKLDPSFNMLLRLLAACGMSLALVPPEDSGFANPELNGRILQDVLSFADAFEVAR